MIYIACIQHPELKKKRRRKKKKRSTYRPSQFSGQKGKQTFIFLGLIFLDSTTYRKGLNISFIADIE